MDQLRELREAVCQANLDLFSRGLAICTWGNVSGICRDLGLVAIKPSGVPYDALTPAMIPIVKLDGERVQGDLRPSSDLATHLELYRSFPAAAGIAHSHSCCATSFAQACRDLPCFGTTHADHFFGTVPVTRKLLPSEVTKDYERNTGAVIAELFADRDPLAVPGALVAHHGPFTWGPSPAAAVTNNVVLEAVARLALDTWQLNRAAAAIEPALLDCHYQRKHGPEAYYGQRQAP